MAGDYGKTKQFTGRNQPSLKCKLVYLEQSRIQIICQVFGLVMCLTKPHDDGCSYNRLDYCTVEMDQQLLIEVELPQLTWDVSLLSLLGDLGYYGVPLKVLGDG